MATILQYVIVTIIISKLHNNSSKSDIPNSLSEHPYRPTTATNE